MLDFASDQSLCMSEENLKRALKSYDIPIKKGCKQSFMFDYTVQFSWPSV